MITSRRAFITGLVSFVAAPAIVRVSSIMPVKNMPAFEDAWTMMERYNRNDVIFTMRLYDTFTGRSSCSLERFKCL